MYRFLPLIFCFFLHCSVPTQTIYKVGVDTTWFPLNTDGQQFRIYGFMMDLLTDIGKETGVKLELVSVNWDSLLDGLEQNKYSAVLTTMQSTLITRSIYSFSEPLLKTGPVLIVEKTSKIKDLEGLEGKIIAMEKTSQLLDFFLKYPKITQEYYQSPSSALQQLEKGVIDAALINSFVAHNSVGDLFPSLEIITYPFTDQGISMVAQKTPDPRLIHKIDQGLEKIIHSDHYQELLEKWELN